MMHTLSTFPACSAPPAFSSDDARWAAMLARDPKADPHFVYAVKTTGTFCRPSSAARLPRRENVEFFDTASSAEAAGYCPSRRLGARRKAVADQRAALVALACSLMESCETACSLDRIAADVGLSPFHFHRIFKSETGLTPKAYASATRARRLRRELAAPDLSVTEAIYNAGFNSNSRFYEEADRLLGMRASEYRAGGRNVPIHFAVGKSVLGAVLVACTLRGICAVLLGDDPDVLAGGLHAQFPRARLARGGADFERRVAQAVGLVEADLRGLHLPPDVRSTAFQERVRQAMWTGAHAGQN